MSTKRAMWILLIGSILGILVSVFGCIYILTSNSEYNERYNERYPSVKSPIRTLSIQIEENQREELFVKLRRFSDKHGLEFYLSFYKNREVFFIVMYSERLEITVSPKPITTTEVQVSFFEKDPSNPSAQETVDALSSDLNSFISEIPNVTITEE